MSKIDLPVRGLIGILIVTGLVAGFFLYQKYSPAFTRTRRLMSWLGNPGAHPEWSIQGGTRCGQAPFLFPTTGYAGYLWGDSFQIGHRHQGIDIFGGEDVGVVPVYAVYAGFLTRQPDWKATVIIRIPDDPHQPGQQIWTYYTHMADADGQSFIVADYPPGSYEVPVEGGALLGYQGNFSGDSSSPVGVHLHFSIVKDKNGTYMNELDIRNTYDPSIYFGLPLNGYVNEDEIPVCGE